MIAFQCYGYLPSQGVLGDCWLLSTCAALAKKEDLLFRVIDPKQVGNMEASTLMV